MSISDFDALFTLIGTTYGGDGQESFGLPDLRGRLPLHRGGSHFQGETGGQEDVTLIPQSLPTHTHPIAATTQFGDQSAPGNNVLAQNTLMKVFIDQGESSDVTLNAASIQSTGGSLPHENRQPYLAINYIISLYGVFPPQG